jgi:hypothetical protein
MGKILISLIAGAAGTLFVVGDIVIDLTSISLFLALSGLFYFIIIEHSIKDEVEILEEYKRGDDVDDPEEILP